MPLDQAGVGKIYPDASFNFKWQHHPTGTQEGNSIFNLRPPKCEGTPDHMILRTRGYMCDRSSDWKNVEVKVYIDADTGNQYFIIHLGGSLTLDSCPCCCFAYQLHVNTNGPMKLRKVTYFGNSTVMEETDVGPMPGGYKGIGFIRYNLHNNSVVVLEAYVDKGTTGNWRRAFRVVDTGFKYGNGGTRCGGTDKEAGVWSFPLIAFQNKGFSYNYQNATAREINPTGGFNESQTALRNLRRRSISGGGGTPLPGYVPAS